MYSRPSSATRGPSIPQIPDCRPRLFFRALVTRKMERSLGWAAELMRGIFPAVPTEFDHGSASRWTFFCDAMLDASRRVYMFLSSCFSGHWKPDPGQYQTHRFVLPFIPLQNINIRSMLSRTSPLNVFVRSIPLHPLKGHSFPPLICLSSFYLSFPSSPQQSSWFHPLLLQCILLLNSSMPRSWAQNNQPSMALNLKSCRAWVLPLLFAT